MNRRQFLAESGMGLVGLVLGLVASTGCATTATTDESQKRTSRYHLEVWYVPRKEAEEVVSIVETYGTLNEEPNGSRTHSLDISAMFSKGETRIYSISVFYHRKEKKLQFNVESKTPQGPHLHRIYHDNGIDGTLDLVTDGFASRPPGKSTFAFINVEKRHITLTKFDDVKGREISQKSLDGEALRSLHDAYTHDLLTFLKLYAPQNNPSVPTGKGMLAMR